jgi:hypothetical protein
MSGSDESVARLCGLLREYAEKFDKLNERAVQLRLQDLQLRKEKVAAGTSSVGAQTMRLVDAARTNLQSAFDVLVWTVQRLKQPVEAIIEHVSPIVEHSTTSPNMLELALRLAELEAAFSTALRLVPDDSKESRGS